MSEVFEVKKKSVLLKLPDGNSLELRVPSVFELQKIYAEMDAAKESPIKNVEILVAFYKKLGMSDEALEFFDSDDFNKLFLFLAGSKKN
mgnify:CR=1 FL=1